MLPAIHFTHLPRIIGRYKAFDLLFSGRTFYSDEALMLGLISRKVLSSEIREKANEIAINLSKKSPISINLIISNKSKAKGLKLGNKIMKKVFNQKEDVKINLNR